MSVVYLLESDITCNLKILPKLQPVMNWNMYKNSGELLGGKNLFSDGFSEYVLILYLLHPQYSRDFHLFSICNKKKKLKNIFKLQREKRNTKHFKKLNCMVTISYENKIWYTRISLQISILISSLGMGHGFWFTNGKITPVFQWFIERCVLITKTLECKPWSLDDSAPHLAHKLNFWPSNMDHTKDCYI